MAGVFNQTVLTDKGIALIAKAQAGRCKITFTKAESGNGYYSASENLKSKTSLKSKKQQFPINTVSVKNASNVFVKFVITNKQASGNLQNGYRVKEIGIYATDPDEGEILYGIAVSDDEHCDYMPAYNDLLASTITVDFLIEVSSSDNVTIQAPNEMYLYDEDTGDKYKLGIKNGLMYYEEVDE